MMGSLDIVAPLVSICFLTCYSALNLSCLVLSAVNAPRSVHHQHQELIFHTEFFHCIYFGFGKHVGYLNEFNLNFLPNVILLQNPRKELMEINVTVNQLHSSFFTLHSSN